MYTDFRIASRDDWKFKYTASNLAEGAGRKLREISVEEGRVRNTVAALLKDLSVPANDKRIDEAKREIERLAEIREKLVVFVHEFTRFPEREYTLSIGDVVFFKLVDTSLKV